MKKNSSKFILTLSVIVLLIVAITLIVNMNKYGAITGKATDTGTANLTINTSASISFTDSDCNFGSGYVDEAPTFAMVWSNGTVVDGQGWDGCTDGLTMSNDGNVNISVNVSSSQVASGFIGGTSPEFKWNSTPSACGGTNDLDSFTTVTDDNSANACDNLTLAATIQLDFELKIPEDAVGTKGTVITQTI